MSQDVESRVRIASPKPDDPLFATVAEMTLFICVKSIANDDRVKCECGTPPYPDGEPCSRCYCLSVLDIVTPLLEKHGDRYPHDSHPTES